MEEKFKINVPYNNEYLVAARKKNNIVFSVIMFMAVAVFMLGTVLSGISATADLWVSLLFLAMALASLGFAIYFIVRAIKPSAKDATKVLTFNFYDNLMDISLTTNKNGNSKTKSLRAVAYVNYKDKQYITKFIESTDVFKIEILVGTYNFVPQYVTETLPKSCFKDEEELNNFITFIKEKVSKYIVKEAKSKN